MFARFNGPVIGAVLLSVTLGFTGTQEAKALDPKQCTADEVVAKGFEKPLLNDSSLKSCLNEHLIFMNEKEKHEFVIKHKDELINSCSCAIAAIEDAIKKYRLATDDDFSSGRAKLYLQRGSYYNHAEDWDRAIADLTDSLKSLGQGDDLARLTVLEELAHAYHGRKDDRRAFDTYVEAARLYKRAGILMSKGQRAFMCEVNRDLRDQLPADLDLTCRY
jgi:tetratricopeptide (TPR) repeat protein